MGKTLSRGFQIIRIRGAMRRTLHGENYGALEAPYHPRGEKKNAPWHLMHTSRSRALLTAQSNV